MFNDKEIKFIKSMLTKVYVSKYSLIIALIIFIIHMASFMFLPTFDDSCFIRGVTVPLLLTAIGVGCYWSNFFQLETLEWIDMELRFRIFGDISFTEKEKELLQIPDNEEAVDEKVLFAPSIYVKNGVSAVAASVVMVDVLQWTMDGVADKIFYMAKLANIDIPEKYEIRRKVIVALIIALVLSCSWVFIPTAL